MRHGGPVGSQSRCVDVAAVWMWPPWEKAELVYYTIPIPMKSLITFLRHIKFIHGNCEKCLEAVQKWRQHSILRARTSPLNLSATRSKWSHTLGLKPRPPILGRQLFPTPFPYPLANVVFGWPLTTTVIPKESVRYPKAWPTAFNNR